MEAWSDSAGSYSITWLNTSSGWQADIDFEFPVVLTEEVGSAQSIRLGQVIDIDADGRVDILVSTRRPGGAINQQVWLNSGSGWVPNTSHLLPGIHLDYSTGAEIQRGQFADINADGRADWLVAYKDTAGNTIKETWLNQESGWVQDVSFTLPAVLFDYQSSPQGLENATLQDINGDGLSDLTQAIGIGSTNYRNTWLNTGAGWLLSSALQPPTILSQKTATGQTGFGGYLYVSGDGRLDLVHAYRNTGGSEVHQVWRNTGAGWVHDNAYALPTALIEHRTNGRDITLHTFVDLNADGISDLANTDSVSAGQGWLNQVASGEAYALPEHVHETENGLGWITRVRMKPSLVDDVFAKSYGAEFPVIDAASAGALVFESESSDGIGSFATIAHQYGGLRHDVHGRGSLGFAWRELTDTRTDIVMRYEYHQVYPFNGRLAESEKSIGDQTLSVSTQTHQSLALNNGKTQLPYNAETITATHDLDGTTINTVTKTMVIDPYGNATEEKSVTVDIMGTYTKTITSTFENNVSNWILGKVTHRTTKLSAPGTPDIARSTQYFPDADGSLEKKIVDVGDPLQLTYEYQYDGFGSPTESKVSAAGQTPKNQ